MPIIKRKHTNDEGLLFCDFIAEKETSGLSNKSIQNYKDVYARFVREVGQKISKNSIRDWIEKMIQNGMNPISINFYLNQIRVFAYWLINNGYCESFEIKKIKTQEAQIKTIPDDELEVLLEKPDKGCKFHEYRTWVIINFIMATGARVSTIINLKISDVDFCAKEIKYNHLKNKRIAIIPMSSCLERILKQYLSLWDVGINYLFPDQFGNQLKVNALGHSIGRYCIKRGIRPRGAHSFRHTFAKHYILNGGNAFVLQKLLTHSDLTMTQKYIRLFDADLKLGFNDICPLDNYSKQQKIIKKVGQ